MNDAPERRSNATRPGTAIVVGAVGVAVAIVAVTLWATALAVVGALALLVGVRHDRARARALGALAVLSAALAGAYTGLPTWGVLAATIAVVVAVDAGERTVGLHAQVPRATTWRLELRRSAWTVAVCALAGGLAVAVATVPSTATPGGAALALLGGVVVALGLRSR